MQTAEEPAIVDVIDPRIGDLLAPRARFRAMPAGMDIAGGDSAGWGRGLDGPVWIQEMGTLAFNDVGHRRRLTWTPGGDVRVLHEATGGATGTARDPQGRFVACEWDGSRVTRREADGTVTLVADTCDGRPLAGPDDVAVAADGTVYFTDPRRAFPPAPPGSMDRPGVYRVEADLSSIARLDCDIAAPGGLALSANGRTLYVNDQTARCVVAFPLLAGRLGPGRPFAPMTGASRSVPHGICLDGAGNVYAGGPGGIWVFAPDGVALGVIRVPGTRINGLAFGGDDGRTLFVVTSSGVGALPTQAVPPHRATATPAVHIARGHPLHYEQRIERLDPALDAIIAPGTRIRNHGHGGFFEDLGGGPHHLYAASLEGTFWSAAERCLFFSDIGNDRRLRFDPATERITVAHAPTGHANGATLDCEGRIVQAEHAGRCISRRERDGTRTVLVDRFQGRRLNHPNDVVVRSDGDLFFTDPWWDFGAGDTREQPHAGVYHFSPARGTLALIGADYLVCNGLAFSHDERTLFVNETYGPPGKDWGPHIRAYDVREDGSIDAGSSRIWARLPLGPREGKPDGMKVDRAGNVYCGGAGGLWIFDRHARHLGIVVHGDTQTNNLCFGGPDWKTLYFVSWVGLHSIELRTPGIPLPPKRPA
ncbi:MAG: SMP-30/gluconolactonase/LRE family protein [Gammaproteobacteria bacterium]